MARCKGTNQKGNRCGSNAVNGSEYCKAHQDQAPKPHTESPSYKNHNMFKSISKYFIGALIGAFISVLFSHFWPHILIQIDKSREMEPKPYVSMRVVEKVRNKNHLNFINKCDDFKDYLIKSKILSKV